MDQFITIWRVCKISCDGGRIGKEWSSEFFFDENNASYRLEELIAESNKRNPKYIFKKDKEEIDGVLGYCNWQFGIMIAIDSVDVRKQHRLPRAY